MSKNILDIIGLDTKSAHDLNEAFSSVPHDIVRYSAKWFDTPLGAMLAIADEHAIVMLDFHDRNSLAGIVLCFFAGDVVRIGYKESLVIEKLEQELKQYFYGEKIKFRTPVKQFGTPFQLAAWASLKKIPYGETRSYQEQAHAIGQPLAHRAVANANGRNKVAIVIPCHRIIRRDKSLGGYGGGVDKKRWLLDLERSSVFFERLEKQVKENGNFLQSGDGGQKT